ncbi:hypothetical protein [Sphingomonas sp.]|uniref:hypothetical protein n=1 Tax=Sphingomonas sp. TaxID=28214 RepID=UPI0035BC94F3
MTQPTVIAQIDAVLAEMATRPEVELGGPAAADARQNALWVAEQLRAMAILSTPLPRHAGKPSPGKLAALISKEIGKRFNRQLFTSNEWCARLLSVHAAWEDANGPSALDAAQAAVEAKEAVSRRESALEEEILALRAENRQLRHELAHLRGFVASTGRMP